MHRTDWEWTVRECNVVTKQRKNERILCIIYQHQPVVTNQLPWHVSYLAKPCFLFTIHGMLYWPHWWISIFSYPKASCGGIQPVWSFSYYRYQFLMECSRWPLVFVLFLFTVMECYQCLTVHVVVLFHFPLWNVPFHQAGRTLRMEWYQFLQLNDLN